MFPNRKMCNMWFYSPSYNSYAIPILCFSYNDIYMYNRLIVLYSFFLFFDRPKAWPRSGMESEALHAIPIVSLYLDIYQQKTGHNS